jgi:hypothetical protein
MPYGINPFRDMEHHTIRSQYVPDKLPLELMMQAGLKRQGDIDASNKAADDLKVLADSVPALSQVRVGNTLHNVEDANLVRSVDTELSNKIDALTEKMHNSPDPNADLEYKREVMKLQKEYQGMLLPTGKLGQIANRYKTYQEQEQQLKNQDIAANPHLANAIYLNRRGYTQGAGDLESGLATQKAVNAETTMDALSKGFEETNIGASKVGVTPGRVRDYVTSMLHSETEIGKDLQAQEQYYRDVLGMPEKDVQANISNQVNKIVDAMVDKYAYERNNEGVLNRQANAANGNASEAGVAGNIGLEKQISGDWTNKDLTTQFGEGPVKNSVAIASNSIILSPATKSSGVDSKLISIGDSVKDYEAKQYKTVNSDLAKLANEKAKVIRQGSQSSMPGSGGFTVDTKRIAALDAQEKELLSTKSQISNDIKNYKKVLKFKTGIDFNDPTTMTKYQNARSKELNNNIDNLGAKLQNLPGLALSFLPDSDPNKRKFAIGDDNFITGKYIIPKSVAEGWDNIDMEKAGAVEVTDADGAEAWSVSGMIPLPQDAGAMKQMNQSYGYTGKELGDSDVHWTNQKNQHLNYMANNAKLDPIRAEFSEDVNRIATLKSAKVSPAEKKVIDNNLSGMKSENIHTRRASTDALMSIYNHLGLK